MIRRDKWQTEQKSAKHAFCRQPCNELNTDSPECRALRSLIKVDDMGSSSREATEA